MTTSEAVTFFALVNAAIGLVLGLIPLLFGYFNKRFRLGVIGFVTALAGGALFGIFVSIPATIIFTWFVVRKSKAQSDVGMLNPPAFEDPTASSDDDDR